MSLSPVIWRQIVFFQMGIFCACPHLGFAAVAPARQTRPAESAETVLDRKIHIEARLVELPQVPPLCDELKLATRRVDVGGCFLHCETEGRGPALVLINGGPGGTHHDFHPAFAAAAGFAQVIYYDQRGCGRSDHARAGAYTVEQAVDDLEKMREAMKLDRWVLLGWSYGGLLAQCYAVKYPDRVAGLVLVGASPSMPLQLGPTRQFDAMAPEERRKIQQLYDLEGKVPNEQLLFNIHLNGDWKRQNFYRPTKEQLARMVRYGWKHDPALRDDIARSRWRIDLSGMFDGCPIPILILEGKHDLTWNEDKPAKFQACFPGSRLVIFERSAHGPFNDEPDRFFDVLKRFMIDLPQKPPSVAEWKAQMAARQAARLPALLRWLSPTSNTP